jgi:hypothetical protein
MRATPPRRWAVVEVQRRPNPVDVRCADPPAPALDLHDLAATHPAHRVDRVHAVVEKRLPAVRIVPPVLGLRMDTTRHGGGAMDEQIIKTQ